MGVSLTARDYSRGILMLGLELYIGIRDSGDPSLCSG